MCAGVAVVVCAWFALGARQAIDTSRARAIADRGSHATAGQERQVASLVHAARLLNPDKQPDVLLGQTEVEHGDFSRAVRVLKPVTRGEPQNIQGWIWLAHAAPDDPTLYNVAIFRAHELEPRQPSS
jgi:hypothetical protein